TTASTSTAPRPTCQYTVLDRRAATRTSGSGRCGSPASYMSQTDDRVQDQETEQREPDQRQEPADGDREHGDGCQPPPRCAAQDATCGCRPAQPARPAGRAT